MNIYIYTCRGDGASAFAWVIYAMVFGLNHMQMSCLMKIW